MSWPPSIRSSSTATAELLGPSPGVLLEIHLAQVAAKHKITVCPTSPDVATLNTALKRDGIYDGEV